MEIPKKIKIKLTIQSNLYSRYLSERIETRILKGCLHACSFALCTVEAKVETTKYTLTDEWIKKTWYTQRNISI